MKKNRLFTAAVLFAFVITMFGCKKADPCRTCKATNIYDNTVVATEKACSEEAEAEFKFRYNSYPTTAKCE